MELAGELHRSPREVLTSLTMREFRAYVLLSQDRADEFDDAQEGIEPDDDDEGIIDLTKPHAPEELAAIFGARVVR